MWWYITREYCRVSGSNEWKYDPTGDLYLPHSRADLDHGQNWISQIFLNAGWRYPAEMSILFLLCILRSVSSLLSLCCFQRVCPLSLYTKEMFKAMVRGPGPGHKCRRFSQCGADGAHMKQDNGVRWVMSVTDDAWWQNPGGERSCGSCQGDSGLPQPETHTRLFFL